MECLDSLPQKSNLHFLPSSSAFFPLFRWPPKPICADGDDEWQRSGQMEILGWPKKEKDGIKLTCPQQWKMTTKNILKYISIEYSIYLLFFLNFCAIIAFENVPKPCPVRIVSHRLFSTTSNDGLTTGIGTSPKITVLKRINKIICKW